MRSRVRSFYPLLLAGVALGVVPSARADVAHLTLDSQPGDFTGQGGTFDITYPSNEISAQIRRALPDGSPAELLFVVGHVTPAPNTFSTLFFGTDVNTAPRRPTPDNPAFHTEDSCAVVALDAATGRRRWNTQLKPADVWTNAMCAYDWNTGLYKDQAIGDTPKILTIAIDAKPTSTPT